MAYAANQVIYHKLIAKYGEIITSAWPYTKARALTVSTGAAVCSIQKNGVQVATMTFSAGNAVPVISSMAGSLRLAAGDYLTLVAPAVPDATLYDVMFNPYTESTG